MDIGSKSGYPAGALSNFSPHPFEIDGVKCNSMEGFLQGLKFESKEMMYISWIRCKEKRTQ